MTIEELGKKPASEISDAEFRALKRYRRLKAAQERVNEETAALENRIEAGKAKLVDLRDDFEKLGEEIAEIERTVETGKLEE